MRRNTCDDKDMPEAAALMAAVIRLMAQCSAGGDLTKIRTLLRLLRTLRDHPDLPRQSAVLASLAEAHAIWVQKLAYLSEASATAAADCDDNVMPRLH